MAATLKMTAEETGLPAMTVRRILNNDGGGHREGTRWRILETARRLAYRTGDGVKQK